MNYGIYYGFKGNLKFYELQRRYHRYTNYKSKNALADILILEYYFNFKNKIIVKDIKNILFRRYRNFTKKIIS